MRIVGLFLKYRMALVCVLAVTAVLSTWLVLSRDRWTALDARQWNAWFPSYQTAADDLGKTVLYSEVHYRVEEEYDFGQRNGQVVLRTRYSDEVTTGPVGYALENSWVSRTIRLFKQGLFKAATWKEWDQQWLNAYRQEEVLYEYICPSQEIRQLKSRLESDDGLYATNYFFHTSGGAGWSSRLGDWSKKVSSRQAVPLLNPLAPIWDRLCGEPHFNWELYAMQKQAMDQKHHRIWMPLPEKIIDPNYTDAATMDAPMDICAEQMPEGQLTCRLLNSGDSPARHALLLKPGRYRFFQRLHGEPQQQSCGNMRRGFGNAGPCNDGKRWYWRRASPSDLPVEVRLQDLGPGTSVGPQISSFSVDTQ